MTWYAVKFDADEKTILENARAFKEKFGAYNDEAPVIWVDWEWYHRRMCSDGGDALERSRGDAGPYRRRDGAKALYRNATVGPGDTLLVRVTPLKATGRTLIGLTRHVTQDPAIAGGERFYFPFDGAGRDVIQ